MAEFELPRRLVRSVEEYADEAPRRRAWLASLPGVVDDLARHWGLSLGRPFQPGGEVAWVAPATGPHGERLVLKAGWRHVEALHEADGLRVWDGRGAVRLVDALDQAETSALLLEACEPGTPLAGARPPHEQDAVVAGLLHQLWVDPPSPSTFRPLSSMCHMWAAEFERRLDAGAAASLDPGLRRTGVELFRTLPDSAGASVLLCTDLHPGNVLAARRAPWLMVDPKPYLGDPTFDALQHMLNFPERLRADPTGLCDRMAALLDLDPHRLRLWAFARCVQESAGQPYLTRVAEALAP